MIKKILLKRYFSFRNEKGTVLVSALLIVLLLAIMSLAAMMSTGTELKIASNDSSAKEVFYLAEAGIEDARSRLQAGSTYPIIDSHPANIEWATFIGTEGKSQQKGFQNTNSNHIRYNRLDPPNLSYVVNITHKLDGSNNILKWGDSNFDGMPEENTTAGNNIYVVRSEGYTSTGATKELRAEVTKLPPITAEAALYTKQATTIQGTSTHVLGFDNCGVSSVPGIVTMATVQQNGNPEITGFPTPIVENSPININVQLMVDQYKKYKNYYYDVNSQTFTGMNWGSPTPGATQQSPTTCSTDNIVYINTNNTYVKLTGGTSGCGMLIVEGDLAVNGGFLWYGPILVTGSVSFTGGGGKNVTGAIIAGGTSAIDLLGGDANLIYCSQANRRAIDDLPLVTLRWVELFY